MRRSPSPGSGAARNSTRGSWTCSPARPASLFAGLDEASSWDAVIGAEPALAIAARPVPSSTPRSRPIADFTDVKSPYTIGHSRGVADLAAEAAASPGWAIRPRRWSAGPGWSMTWGGSACRTRSGTSRAALSHAETERVRLHPYLTERMLACSPALAPLAAVAVQHHERLDGSGYPRGLSGGALSPEGRVLAAADFYHARTEPRPHRPACTADEAAAQLEAEARAGRLDGERGRRRAVRGRAPGRPPASEAGRADRPRGRGAPVAGPRPVEQGDRRAPGHLAQDGRPPRRAHLRQDRHH